MPKKKPIKPGPKMQKDLKRLKNPKPRPTKKKPNKKKPTKKR